MADGLSTKSSVSALLFAAPGPVPLSKLADILSASEDEIMAAIADLKAEWDADDRGVSLEEIAGGFAIFTRPEYSGYIEKLLQPDPLPRLSQAALEVLSIIMYRQPVARPDIDTIRGVNSEGALLTLVERGLVRVTGRKDTVGRPFLYGVTEKCLNYFGIKGPEDLPSIEDWTLESLNQ